MLVLSSKYTFNNEGENTRLSNVIWKSLLDAFINDAKKAQAFHILYSTQRNNSIAHGNMQARTMAAISDVVFVMLSSSFFPSSYLWKVIRWFCDDTEDLLLWQPNYVMVFRFGLSGILAAEQGDPGPTIRLKVPPDTTLVITRREDSFLWESDPL